MVIRHYARISVSLVALMVLILFIADWSGFVPNESESRLRARIDFSESLATQLSIAAKKENMEIISETIKSVVERNEHVKSILLREMDNAVITSYGVHPPASNDMRSTPDLMKVPIFRDKIPWGMVEVSFVPMEETYLWGLVSPSFLRLLAFTSAVAFIFYLFLVRKILSHIDPYKVIPGRVRVALNALSEGVVLVDDEERIVLSNKSFENKTESSTDQLMGKKLSTLPWSYPERTVEDRRVLPWLKTISEGKENNFITMNLERRENDKITLVINSAPLKDSREKVRGAIISFSDVTELEKMNQDMESMMSFLRHETRNALLGASSTVALLEKSGHLSAEDKLLLSRAKKSHRVIKKLLDSVREAKSIESSFSGENTEPVRMIELLRDVAGNYSKIYGDNSFVFESEEHELIVLGNEERLVEMLDKLVSNAVDHSDKEVPIVISCQRENDDAVIKVINQGEALPEDKQGIFDLFSSFRNTTATKHNQGIGLYVVKLIAEMYGGTVEARDREDVTGAEFIIRLPAV